MREPATKTFEIKLVPKKMLVPAATALAYFSIASISDFLSGAIYCGKS